MKKFGWILSVLFISSLCFGSAMIQDGSVVTKKLNSQVIQGMTTVVAAMNDFVSIADTSDSGNFKKALVSTVQNINTRSVTTTDTANATTDSVLILSGASFTENLPTAVGNLGKVFSVVHNGTSISQVYTIDPAGAELINGQSTYQLFTNGEVLRFVSNNVSWTVLSHSAQTNWSTLTPLPTTGYVTATTTSPTLTATTIVSQVSWRRDGRDALVTLDYKAANGTGAAGNGDYIFLMPGSLIADTTLVTAYSVVVGSGAGGWVIQNTNTLGFGDAFSGTNTLNGTVTLFDSTHFRICGSGGPSNTFGGCAGNGSVPIGTNNGGFSANFRVPIVGWNP